MKRTFPIYKGKDLSKMGMGYSNIKSARKFMTMDLIIEDFDKLFDDEYWFEHHYLLPLEKTKSYYKNMWGGYTPGKEYSIDYQADYRAEHEYLPTLPEDVKVIVKEFMKLKKDWWKRRVLEEQIRMDELMMQLADKGYSPHVYKDDKDYKKKLSKFVTENVQFVEKEVEITIK